MKRTKKGLPSKQRVTTRRGSRVRLRKVFGDVELPCLCRRHTEEQLGEVQFIELKGKAKGKAKEPGISNINLDYTDGLNDDDFDCLLASYSEQRLLPQCYAVIAA